MVDTDRGNPVQRRAKIVLTVVSLAAVLVAIGGVLTAIHPETPDRVAVVRPSGPTRTLVASATPAASDTPDSVPGRGSQDRSRGRITKRTGIKPVVPKQVSVRFGSISTAEQNALGRKLGFRVVRAIPHIGWTIVEPVSGKTVSEVTAALDRTAGVKAAEPAHLVYPSAIPNDPGFADQWGYRNAGQLGGVAGMDASATAAWDWSRGDGTVVAVTDTGIDFGNPDLAGKAWVNPADPVDGIDNDGNGLIDDTNGWDFLNGDNTLFDEKNGDKHGTHVAGIIGAQTNNGVGVSGMGWNTKIMALKFLGIHGGSDVNAAAAIVYAVDHGARVINASWGGTAFSQTQADAVAYAASKGVLIVAAAGNSTADNDVSPDYPASMPATNIVSVAAIDRVGALATYSNWGATTVDLGAPGTDVLSTMSRVPAALYVDKSPYKIVYCAFPVESMTSVAGMRALIGDSLSVLATNTASQVLVVDDSWPSAAGEGATTRLSAYTSSLSALGYSSVSTWSTQASGTPSPATMAGKTVVWFTGAATYGISNWQTVGTLGSADRTALSTFLDGGGRLLMSSGDLGFDMTYMSSVQPATLTWYHNYMHASFVDDDPWTSTWHGASGTILSGLDGTVDDALRYSDGFDDVAPYDSYASIIARWDHYATISGTSMATPQVSGALALALARRPTLTGTQLKDRLLSTVTPTSSLAGKTVTGGRLNAASVVGTLPAPAPLLVGPAGPGALSLAWTNPTDADFSATRLLVRADADPTGPTDPSATVVYEGSASTATHTGVTVGTTLHYAAYSHAVLGGWSEAARVTTTVADLPAGPGAAMPVGTDVSVTVDGVTVTFPQVNAPGWLSVTRMAPRQVPPANFVFVNNGYYEIHAVGDYAMPATVTVSYAPADVTNPAGVRFFHYTGGTWTDVTTSVDAANNRVIASTPSFSDFAVSQPAASGSEALDAEKPWTAPLLAVTMLVGLVIARRRQARSVR